MREPREWTEHRYTCIACGRVSRVSKSALEQLLADLRTLGPEPNVAQVVADLVVCISCLAGREVAGEHIDAVTSTH